MVVQNWKIFTPLDIANNNRPFLMARLAYKKIKTNQSVFIVRYNVIGNMVELPCSSKDSVIYCNKESISSYQE